jgi:hypothetical protein
MGQEKWTPNFGQPDKCRSGYAAFRWSANPKYTVSGVLRSSDWCRRSLLKNAMLRPIEARAWAMLSQAFRSVSSYFRLRQSRSMNPLSTYRPFPSMLMRIPCACSTEAKASLVN